MNPDISFVMIKLENGERLLRLEHASSGICLEKRIDPAVAIASQKQKWLAAFEGLLARELTPV
jgi:hypothetical protein